MLASHIDIEKKGDCKCECVCSCRMGVSEDDKTKVQKSWSLVSQNLQGIGNHIFKTFLDKHSYYGKFPIFAGISILEIPQHPYFKEYALRLMKTLDATINSINDQDRMEEIIFGLGKAHKKRGITIIQFEEMRDVIIQVLKETYKINSDLEAAYRRVFDVILNYIACGLH